MSDGVKNYPPTHIHVHRKKKVGMSVEKANEFSVYPCFKDTIDLYSSLGTQNERELLSQRRIESRQKQGRDQNIQRKRAPQLDEKEVHQKS